MLQVMVFMMRLITFLQSQDKKTEDTSRSRDKLMSSDKHSNAKDVSILVECLSVLFNSTIWYLNAEYIYCYLPLIEYIFNMAT